MSIHQNSGSFRDPFGYIFHKNDTIFRTILSPAIKQYEAIRDEGLIQESIEQGFLIESKELTSSTAPAELKGYFALLRIPKIMDDKMLTLGKNILKEKKIKYKSADIKKIVKSSQGNISKFKNTVYYL